jgi:hypothetical protein
VHAQTIGEGAAEAIIRRIRQELPLTDVVVWAPGGAARFIRDVLQAGVIDVVLGARPEVLAEFLHALGQLVEYYQVDTGQPLAAVVEREVRAVESRYQEACLRRNPGRMEDTARQAGISRRTLLRKLQRLGLDRHRYRPGGVG